MTTELKQRRGSTNELALFTPALAELVVDTDKNVLRLGDGLTAGGLPLTEGHGTAAALDVTTSATDTTADRITKVGDFGIGAGNSPVITNWDTTREGGIYNSLIANQSGSPDDGALAWMGIVGALNSDNVFQQVWRAGAVPAAMYTRFHITGTNWTDWVEILTNANLAHLQNTSGGTITSAATVAGSGLTPAQTGTWRNVSGASIFDTGYGLWRLV